MSGVRFILNNSAPVTLGTSKTTVLQGIAASDHRNVYTGVHISFNGTSNTAEPILVEIELQSDGGGGGDSVTPAKVNPSDPETLQVTGQELIDNTTQPSVTSVLLKRHIHPQGGLSYQCRFAGEWPVRGGQRIGVSLTCPAAVDAVVTLEGEE